jgi:hypothetical protein
MYIIYKGSGWHNVQGRLDLGHKIFKTFYMHVESSVLFAVFNNSMSDVYHQ